MVRIETEDGWLLLNHQDHAQLAGAFADHWGNDLFVKPEPFSLVREGVAKHDDAWVPRDAEPEITREGLPSAFSKELVGTYDAFEEIDLEEYLQVRGNATEAVADALPYSATLISMHTVNLLTEQADLSTLDAEQTKLHSAFIDGQLNRQKELIEVSKEKEGSGEFTSEAILDQNFKFLQCCDSLSLTVCVQFPTEIKLRHAQVTTSGELKEVTCYPEGNNTYRLDPYPFDADVLEFQVPFKRVRQKEFSGVESFRALVAAAEQEYFIATLKK